MLPDWAGYQRFRDALGQANQSEFYPVEWLDQQVLRGLSWPIIGEAAAVVVGTRMYPGGARAGLVKAAAGDLDELINALAPKAEDWAREHGCAIAMVEGREGWARVLKRRGWQHYQTIMRKAL